MFSWKEYQATNNSMNSMKIMINNGLDSIATTDNENEVTHIKEEIKKYIEEYIKYARQSHNMYKEYRGE